MNDQINTVLNRYEAFKKGDYATARNPVPAELSNQSTSGQSLIDFDDAPAQNQSANDAAQDDLAGLFGSSAQTSQPPQYTNPLVGGMGMGAMNMGFSNQSIPTTHSPAPVMGGMGTMGNPMFRNTSMSPPAIMLPSTPANGSPGPRNGTPGTPGGGLGMNMGMSSPPMGAGMGMGFGGMGTGMVTGMGMSNSPKPQQQQRSLFQNQSQTQQQPQTASSNSSTTQTSGKDPFADLAGLF
jgi:ADP-ribosylation factor-binding protein GGA